MGLSNQDKKTILDFFELLFKINEKPQVVETPEPKRDENKHGRIIPLAKWNEFHDYPKVSTLRWYRFNSYKNGFDKCIRNIGKRLYISEDEFFLWLDNNSKQP